MRRKSWDILAHQNIMVLCNVLTMPTSGNLQRAVIEFLEGYLCQLILGAPLDFS
jgi:hypothetical protein